MNPLKKHIHFVINPVSGHNRKKDLPEIIQANLDHNIFSYTYALTEFQGHARELSQKAVNDGVDIIAAIGGDGTVNEVASAVKNSATSFAVIPSGSGNGFAMHIGMGRNTVEAIKKLSNCEEKLIDTCMLNNEFFLNVAGVGFDALIAYKAMHAQKRGFQMYLSMVLKEARSFEAQSFEIELADEHIEGNFTTIAVANAAMYGYHFSIAPQAELTDGLFDVVFIKEASVLKTVMASWRMLNKSIHKSNLVKVVKTKALIIRTKKPYYYHIDGESFKFEGALRFSIAPKSLKVLFPK